VIGKIDQYPSVTKRKDQLYADGGLRLRQIVRWGWGSRPDRPCRGVTWLCASLFRIGIVHFINGRHRPLFTSQALHPFESSTYRISPDSNRMGYRMVGPCLERANTRDVLSETTNLGTAQVPADGAPIVLMADYQTTGGYAKIAEIASADIPHLAQLRLGQEVRFGPCSLAQALALAQTARDALACKTRALG